jgi:two-component system CheB/CheR fusion protein
VKDALALDSVYAGSIVATVREPLLLLDADLRVVLANTSFGRAFGVTREEVEGRLLYEIGDGAWNIAALRHLLETVLPRDSEMRDFEVIHEGPPRRTLLLNARRLAHEDGRVRLILLAFEDVTERKRLQTALEETMAELERSNHELEAFASIASHDLQEPLRKIMAFGERLEHACEGALPEKGKDYLTRMTGAAARMQRLINDLLMLSRVTTRGDAWTDVALGTVVSEVLGDLEVMVQRSGGRVECGPLPVIQADATQMRQLFQNLVGNALKFRGADPPVIRIDAAAVSRRLTDIPIPGDTPIWRIEIADNGIGFDPRHAQRIFRPFERLHAREAFEGTGIGLAISQRIVQRHGGTIRAESTPGEGSRFILHLPARQTDKS